jgi:hypothetical protein
MLLIITLGAALLGGTTTSVVWYLLRLWQALPRRNADMVLF